METVHPEPRGAARTVRCRRGHSFDVARQGYVDLTGGAVTHGGDTPDMVAARQSLLGAGHLAAVTAGLLDAVGQTARGLALDVGAGTGHHLARLLDARPALMGLAIDVSKAALRRAGRAHPRMAAVRADVWRGLPVADGAADVLLDVFAPRSAAEFHRVLRPGGTLVVVTPGPRHLAEIVDRLGLLTVDPAKRRRLAATLTPRFDLVAEHERTVQLRLSRAEAAALVQMGPSAWHVGSDRLAARLDACPEPIDVTVAVQLSAWRPRSGPQQSLGDNPEHYRGDVSGAVGGGIRWRRDRRVDHAETPHAEDAEHTGTAPQRHTVTPHGERAGKPRPPAYRGEDDNHG